MTQTHRSRNTPERLKGPVTLRGDLVPDSTTDQRLLDGPNNHEWLHSDPWRVLRIQSEFVEGFGALAELGRAVSVFGSARTRPDQPSYALGVEVGRLLAEAGYATITGAGRVSWRPPTRARARPAGCRWAWASSCRSSRG